MEYNIEDYYYHTISKDDKELSYAIFETVVNDKKIKSQRLLGKDVNKFNGLDYISLAAYVKNSEYNTFVISKEGFDNSKLSNMFKTYDEYLSYLKLDSLLEEPLSREEFFERNNTTNKRDYFNYLDSISRTFPVDMEYMLEQTKDDVYKRIIELNGDNIVNCSKSSNCFDDYIRLSKGITFVFPKSIETVDVTIIPNLPFEIESKLVETIASSNKRYSNQIGEVQAKDFVDITKSVGLILADDIDKEKIRAILIKNDLKYSIFKIEGDQLFMIDNFTN